jgi:hypothetical protein
LRAPILIQYGRILDPHLLDGNAIGEIFEMHLVIKMRFEILFLEKSESNLSKLEEIVIREENMCNNIDRVKYNNSAFPKNAAIGI